MQAVHMVLVQILPYNCSETDYSFCEDSPPAGLCPLPGCGFHPQTPLAPTIFCSAAPVSGPPQMGRGIPLTTPQSSYVNQAFLDASCPELYPSNGCA